MPWSSFAGTAAVVAATSTAQVASTEAHASMRFALVARSGSTVVSSSNNADRSGDHSPCKRGSTSQESWRGSRAHARMQPCIAPAADAEPGESDLSLKYCTSSKFTSLVLYRYYM